MRKVLRGVAGGALLLSGVAIIAGAQGPPPGGDFGKRGPGPGGRWPACSVRRAHGRFRGQDGDGETVQASFRSPVREACPATRSQERLPAPTPRRGRQHLPRREINSYWSVGCVRQGQGICYIRDEPRPRRDIVNVTKGTYEAFAIHVRTAPQGTTKTRPESASFPNEAVTDNPNGTYTSGHKIGLSRG